jgi:hypothetical protein
MRSVTQKVLFLSTFFLLMIGLASTTEAQLLRRRRCCNPPPTCAPVPTCCQAACSPFVAPASAAEKTALSAFNYHGTRYTWAIIEGVGTEPELEQRMESLSPRERVLAASGENFAGSHRKAAKTSISDGPLEVYASLPALLTDLKSDDFMRNHHNPPLETDPDFDRVEEEEKNVEVPGSIVAIKKEPDNDYHIILVSNGAGPEHFMNIEVTGLPPTGPDRAPLKAVRQVLKDFLEEVDVRVGNRYVKFNPPVPVVITGSLFYDIDHAPGVVGPAGMRPDTAWEIHPVTKIVFP